MPGLGKGCSLKQSPRLTPLVPVVTERSVQSPKWLHVCAATVGHEFASMKQRAAPILEPNTPHEMLPLGVSNDATGLPP